VNGVSGPIFLRLQFLTFCVTYYQPYEDMTGPKSSELLLTECGTCPKPTGFLHVVFVSFDMLTSTDDGYYHTDIRNQIS